MRIRRATSEDFPAIQAIYAKGNYTFKMPDLSLLASLWVVEEDGKIVGWAGAKQPELVSELAAGIDPDWAAPARKMQAFHALHLPLAKDLEALNVVQAVVDLEPKYKSFGRHLINLGSWRKNLWETLWIRIKDITNGERR